MNFAQSTETQYEVTQAMTHIYVVRMSGSKFQAVFLSYLAVSVSP